MNSLLTKNRRWGFLSFFSAGFNGLCFSVTPAFPKTHSHSKSKNTTMQFFKSLCLGNRLFLSPTQTGVPVPSSSQPKSRSALEIRGKDVVQDHTTGSIPGFLNLDDNRTNKLDLIKFYSLYIVNHRTLYIEYSVILRTNSVNQTDFSNIFFSILSHSLKRLRSVAVISLVLFNFHFKQFNHDQLIINYILILNNFAMYKMKLRKDSISPTTDRPSHSPSELPISTSSDLQSYAGTIILT